MAKLINQTTKEEVYLLALHLVGRHTGSCHTVLNNPQASRIHATISWCGEQWSIQDNSTNGTYLNGKRIDGYTNYKLQLNDTIYFASQDAGVWTFVDDSEPCCMLQMLAPDSKTVLLEQLAVLPNEDSPQVCLYIAPDGKWVCEQDNDVRVLSNNDKILLEDGQLWQFIEASGSDTTIRMSAINQDVSSVSAEFEVSQSEEHVSLVIVCDGKSFNLGERTHHYLLLLLARQYLSDQNDGLNPRECGWVDKEQLAKMVQMEEVHINMQIYRFRKQVADATKTEMSMPQLVERRKGELRFVCREINILGGMQM